MIKIGNRHILFILLLTVFNATLWADISLKTSVDKKQVAINDTLTLKFEISGNRDLPNANLPQINDFQILGTSRISRISILNGQVNKVLESNYTLAPKRMGQITIPSFAFNYEGKKYTTDAISITVVAAGSQQTSPRGTANPNEQSVANIFIEMSTPKKRYYLGEPVITTLKLFNRMSLFGQPSLKDPDMINLNKDSKLETLRNSYQKTVYNRQFNVDEISWTLFAKEAGKAEIGQQTLYFSVSPFEPNRETSSTPLSLEILAIPKYTGIYNQAIGNFTIAMLADKHNLSTNDGIYIHFIVSGNGNLRLSTQPSIKVPNDTELFDPKINLNEKLTNEGLQSSKSFEYLFIPRSPGTYTIPPVTWTYFDPNLGQYITRQTNSLNFYVKKGNTPRNSSNIPLTQQAVSQVKEDINYIKLQLGPINSLPYHKNKLYIIYFSTCILILYLLKRHIRNVLKMGLNIWTEKRKISNIEKQANTFYSDSYNLIINTLAKKIKIKAALISKAIITSKLEKNNDILAIYNYFENLKFSPEQTTQTEKINSDKIMLLKILNYIKRDVK